MPHHAPSRPAWNWGWIVSYKGCRCAHAAVREEEDKEQAEEETFFLLLLPASRRGRGVGRREAPELGWEGVTEEAGGHWKSPVGVPLPIQCPVPCKAAPPPAHAIPQPSPPRCCGQGGPLTVESLVQVSKKFKTKTHEMKWEFLCQVPSEPERLVYSLMKFLLQSLPLFSTGDLCFL